MSTAIRTAQTPEPGADFDAARRELHRDRYWMLRVVWLAAATFAVLSLALDYLRPDPGQLPDRLVFDRLVLAAAILVALWIGRRGLESRAFVAAACVTMAAILNFNHGLIGSDPGGWTRFCALTLLEVFLIGISFAPYRLGTLLAVSALGVACVAEGVAGRALDSASLVGGTVLVGMAILLVVALAAEGRRLQQHHLITLSRQREQQRELQRLADIVEKTASNVLVLDASLRIRWTNSALAKLVGRPVEDLVGSPLSELFSEQDRAADPVIDHFLEAPGARPIRHRSVIRRADGEPATVEWHMHPLLDDDGAVESYNITGTDITPVIERLRRQELESAQNATMKRVMELALTRMSTREFLDTVLSELIGKTPWLHAGNVGAVFLRDGDADCLRIEAAYGLSDNVTRMCGRNDLSECTCGITAAEQRMLFDSTAAERHTTSLGFSDTSSLYNVPMVHQGRVEGVLMVFMDAEHTLARDEVDFLERIAAAVAVGVVNRAYQAEKDETAQELSEFFDVALDLLGIADLDTRPVKLNRAWNRFLDSDADVERLMRDGIMAFIHPGDQAAARGAIDTLGRGDKIEGFTVRFLAGEQGWRKLEWRATPATGGHFYFSARDITEREALLESLVANNQRLAEISQLSGVGGWHWDFEDDAFTCNEQMQRIFEFTEDDVPDPHTVFAFAPQEEREKLRELIGTALLNHEGWDLEHQIITRSQRRLWVRSVASPVVRNDRLVAVAGSVQDITSRKEHEQAIEAARVAAERANAAKTDFLANMSHEIRTPITGILGMLDIQLDTALADSQRANLQEARGAASNLLSIVNDILDYTKLEAGALETEYVPFELDEIVGQVRTLFQHRAEAKGLELAFAQAPMPTRLMSDPARIRQVMINLVGNALKFTDKGQIRTRCEWLPDLEASEAGNPCGTLSVTVADTGIGIPGQALQRLFSRFSQADNSTTRRYGGTGLGLAISKQIIEQLGGEIGVDSVEGRGSTFWFTLPCGVREDGASASMPTIQGIAAPAATIEKEARKKLNLLVAEDNPVNQKIVSAFLKKGGHAFTITDNGLDAVAAVRTGAFDLVLMDIQMPKLDGIGATREIRRLQAPLCDVPIVALTANAMVGDRERYMAAGMDAYVPKPINRELLLDTIDETLDKRQSRGAGTIEMLNEPQSGLA